jgi:hypothetical protein
MEWLVLRLLSVYLIRLEEGGNTCTTGTTIIDD